MKYQRTQSIPQATTYYQYSREQMQAGTITTIHKHKLPLRPVAVAADTVAESRVIHTTPGRTTPTFVPGFKWHVSHYRKEDTLALQ